MQKFTFVLLVVFVFIISCKKEKTLELPITKTTTPKGVDSIAGTYIGTTQVVNILDTGGQFGTRRDTTMQTDTIFISKITDTTFLLHFKFNSYWGGFPEDDTVVYRDSNIYKVFHYPTYLIDFSLYPKNDSIKLYTDWVRTNGSGGLYTTTTFKGKK